MSYFKNYPTINYKFGDETKDKIFSIVPENSQDPNGMKELLKMLDYE